MSGDRLTRTVREQVALGRLLPLGDGDDPVWITERAAVLALRRGCAALPGARLGSVAVLLQDGDAHDGGAHDGDALDGGPDRGAQDGGPDRGAPDRGHPDRGRPGLDAAPLGALPHGPLRITAAFEASAAEPLPATAERLRQALFTAAREGLGLAVEVVDLEVAGLLDEGDEGVDEEGSGAESHGRAGVAEEAAPPAGAGPASGTGSGPALSDSADARLAVEAALRAVPGVADLAGVLAGTGGLRVRDSRPPAEPGRRVQVQLAAAPGHHALTVGRLAAAAARAAAAPGAPGPVAVAVLVTSA